MGEVVNDGKGLVVEENWVVEEMGIQVEENNVEWVAAEKNNVE